MPNKESLKSNKKKIIISVEGNNELEPRLERIPPKKTKRRKIMWLVIFVVLLFLAILLSVGGYFLYLQNTKTRVAPFQLSEKEAKSLVDEVGRVFLLPSNQVPQIGTVTDKTKLASQSFFRLAENGDKVLIFTEAKEAILYRPSIRKIVAVGPITVTSDQSSNQAITQDSQASKSASVIILNGTQTIGLTQKYEDLLNEKLPQIEVLKRGNAKRSDYEETVVVPVSPAFATIAESVAKEVKGKVALSLPQGEEASQSADLIIILGKSSNL